ncbi:MAG: energy-coupling factor ABC transporter substrate-binding protein [Peptococcaceae bacterium]|nr:energy-coupling factor ABC transporter substrate-binding protein [Peptococcaceae bacterium]
MSGNLWLKNLVLLLAVLALIFFPLLVQRDAEFGGADDRAGEVIAEIRPGYEPWFKSLWEPPSGEVESLFFSLQAAAGSGLVCYYLGYLKGRRKEQEERVKHVRH